MKLVSKERIGGRIKRQYGTPMTPCQNLIQSKQLSKEAEEQLMQVYHPLNPATHGTNLHRHTKPRMVTSFMIQQAAVRLPS
jgi:hypothetical protein